MKKENIPIGKRKIFQFEKANMYSNLKKANIPIRGWKIFQLGNGKYF